MATPEELAAIDKEIGEVGEKMDAEKAQKILAQAQQEIPRESLREFAQKQLSVMAEKRLREQKREQEFEHQRKIAMAIRAVLNQQENVTEISDAPSASQPTHDISEGKAALSAEDMEDPTAAIAQLLREQEGFEDITDDEIDAALSSLESNAA